MENHHVNSTSSDSVDSIPVDCIDVLNPRDRNEKVFSEIVESIRLVGLKKPITVTRSKSDPTKYQLICGEGRLKAFKILGETMIPARIIDVDKEEALIMSLVENIARRSHRSLELLSCIGRLSELGYDKHTISQKIGLVPEYIQGIITLLKNGEERLLTAVETGRISLNVALTIVTASNNNVDLQIALQDAYDAKELKGHELLQARKVIERRQLAGKSINYSTPNKSNKVSAYDLVKTYRKEVERQQIIVKKSEQNQQRLTFIIGALRQLGKDENFATLLRAESLDDLPQYLSERVKTR